MIRSHRKLARRDGVTAVEFALTFPLLLLFLFATYELGRANMMVNTCEAACYEGARVAIVPGANVNEAVDAVQAILATAGIRNANIAVTPDNLAEDTDTLRVEVSFAFKDNFAFGNIVMSDSAQISRACELTREKL